ncbi:DUF2535 family protein [Neobacillus jeddahensis]|uniref:DUF2535 family protein n=1 Tax=Neobacillus jeddahensis TaxID=1461580 RepID=UPI000590BCBE|nr:DUF2535 family protein [Neobacillus jeddahensis]
MLVKSIEFKNAVGQKVKVMDIPVLEENSSFNFMIQVRLQTFLASIEKECKPKKCYSFKEYLKQVMKWPDYEQLFNLGELKHNA